MAISANYQVKSNVNVYIGTEVTMGTVCVPDGGAWNLMPVVDYSVTDKQASLGVGPQRANSFGQDESLGQHDRTAQVYEVSLTMHGTAKTIDRACLALFGDDAQPNDLTGQLPSINTYTHGASNASPVTILFENGGSSGNDLEFKSCVCSGLELAYAIGTDGGALSAVVTFVTGYEPIEAAVDAVTSPTDCSGAVFNIFDLSTNSLNGEDLMVYDFSCSIQRAVNKVGYRADANFEPHGYAIGPYEVTGSVSCKRDSESSAVPVNTSAGIPLVMTDGAFEINAPKVMVESVSTDLADEGWRHSFAWRAFHAAGTESANIVTIGTA